MEVMKEKGFILVAMLFLMLLIGVTAMALNRRSGLQARMAANQSQAVQISLGQIASVEQAIWKLTGDPMWWTDAANKDYTYDGVLYTRTVQKSVVSGYTDATTVSVTAPGSQFTAKASVRYYIRPPISTPGISSTIQQVCMDTADNIYFAVKDDHVIYRRDAFSGDITIVVGNGTSGFSGDGAPAVDAQLKKPEGVAIDASGNLYIADTENNRIRKVTALTGIIDTIAGIAGPGGYSGDEGPATSAKLNKPRAVAVWGNDVFISDTDNHRIRRIDGSTGDIDTVAGTGTGGDSADDQKADEANINHPEGIYIVPSGDFYFADKDNHRIRRVLYSTNEKIYAYAGSGTQGYAGDGGLPTAAQMDKPTGIWMDSSGRIVTGDSNNNVLRRIIGGSTISSLYTPGVLGLSNPRHIRVDAGGDLYIADTSNHRILRLSAEGDVSIVAGTGSSGYSGDTGPATSAQLDNPGSIALDAAGNLYIADAGNHCIRKVTKSTGDIDRIAGVCETSGDTGNDGLAINALFDSPWGVYYDTTGGDIYVADYNNCWIRKFSEGGNITRYAGAESGGSPSCGSTVTASALTTELDHPLDIFVDSSGNGYIADTGNSKIWKVDTSDQISLIAGTGTAGYTGDGALAVNAQIDAPRGLVLDSAGNLYFTDKKRHVVRVISVHNDFIYTLAGTGSGGYNGTDMPAVWTQLDVPAGIDMLNLQGGRRIYIADADNSRIRILDYTIEKLLN